MDKTLKTLLDELDESDEVTANEGSMATIVLDINDPNVTKVLDVSDCCRLLQSEDTVRRMFSAIGHPENASIELEGIEVSCAVNDTLEELFVDVRFN